jgi:hypothetical protein
MTTRCASQEHQADTLLPRLIRLALLTVTWGITTLAATAQYNTGLPTAGNGGSPADSQVSIDAKQFASGATDMCDAINQACGKLSNSLTSNPYPAGAVIDARGYTGNQVCKAGTITTMLYQCAQTSAHGATGGKLLLGDVNLYADGPTANP